MEEEMDTAVRDYCPACQKTVEYELYDGDYYCSICGRTKKGAEEKVQYDKQRKSVTITKTILKTIGITLIILLILWGWIVAPGRMGEALSRGTGYIVILIIILIISGIFYGIKGIINKSKKSNL